MKFNYNFIFHFLKGLTLQIMFYRIVYKFYKELLQEHESQDLENSNTIFILYDDLNQQS